MTQWTWQETRWTIHQRLLETVGEGTRNRIRRYGQTDAWRGVVADWSFAFHRRLDYTGLRR